MISKTSKESTHKTRRNATLDDLTVELLRRAGGSNSKYIDKTLQDHTSQWQRSLLNLMIRQGWESNEILAACDVFTRSPLYELFEKSQIGLEVSEALRESADEDFVKKWNLNKEDWESKLKELAFVAAYQQTLEGLCQRLWEEIGQEERKKVLQSLDMQEDPEFFAVARTLPEFRQKKNERELSGEKRLFDSYKIASSLGVVARELKKPNKGLEHELHRKLKKN